jgi:hypothetical protein
MQPLLQALSVATADELYGEQVEIDYPTNLWGGVVDAAHEDVRGGTISSGGLSGALSSNTFNCFNAVEGGASEDMPVAAEHLPMLVNDGAVGAGTAPCYLFGASYFNSVPPPDPENPDKQKEDKKATQPLAFATFYHDDSLGCTVGTTVGVFQLPPHPLYVQSLRLHQQEGLLNAYHYLRDKLLRQGAYILRATLDSRITIHENEVYLFDGQPVMVESVTETLGASTQEVKLQSIKIMDEIPDDDGH